MTTTWKRIVCCHCGHVSTQDDPVRTNYPERSRNGVARCVDAAKCTERQDRRLGK